MNCPTPSMFSRPMKDGRARDLAGLVTGADRNRRADAGVGLFVEGVGVSREGVGPRVSHASGCRFLLIFAPPVYPLPVRFYY